MGILSEFKTGVIKTKIGGKNIPLKPLKTDKLDIISLLKEEYSVEKATKLRNVLHRVVKQGIESSGEMADEVEIDNFLTQYEDKVYIELSIIFGWQTRKEAEIILEDEPKKKGLKKNLDES